MLFPFEACPRDPDFLRPLLAYPRQKSFSFSFLPADLKVSSELMRIDLQDEKESAYFHLRDQF